MVLDIKKLNVTLNKDSRILVRDFSFTLNPGDKAALIGEEGNGKSTLLKLIYDPELVEGYCTFSGEINRHGAVLGYLEQEMLPNDLKLSIYEYFLKYTTEKSQNPSTVSDVFVKLGLDPGIFYDPQPVGTLSGGEKIKLQLARILLGEPDILLLDEPTNDLDIETVEWMENFIASTTLPVLYISHDETLLENTANVIIHLEQLRKKKLPRHTIEKTGYRNYVEARASRFEHQERVARKERAEYEARVERWRQIYSKVEHRQNTISRADPGGGRLHKKKIKALKSAKRRFEREKEEFAEIPDTEDAITVSFEKGVVLPESKRVLELHIDRLCPGSGDRVLARDVNLTVVGPEHIGIIGRNGTGKTTLLRAIAEELLRRTDLKAGYMPQNYHDLLDTEMTPIGFLTRNGSGSKEELTEARTLLGCMRYTHEEMTGRIGSLSGGQKAKLLYLDMILGGCNVLILDEPTRNFTPLSNPVIRKTLVEFGGAIISSTHDRKFLNEVCDKVYRLTAEGLFPV
jgi:ATPase subunit of ABC transporter with duplicated ATPase domains